MALDVLMDAKPVVQLLSVKLLWSVLLWVKVLAGDDGGNLDILPVI